MKGNLKPVEVNHNQTKTLRKIFLFIFISSRFFAIQVWSFELPFCSANDAHHLVIFLCHFIVEKNHNLTGWWYLMTQHKEFHLNDSFPFFVNKFIRESIYFCIWYAISHLFGAFFTQNATWVSSFQEFLIIFDCLWRLETLDKAALPPLPTT